MHCFRSGLSVLFHTRSILFSYMGILTSDLSSLLHTYQHQCRPRWRCFRWRNTFMFLKSVHVFIYSSLCSNANVFISRLTSSGVNQNLELYKERLTCWCSVSVKFWWTGIFKSYFKFEHQMKIQYALNTLWDRVTSRSPSDLSIFSNIIRNFSLNLNSIILSR